jgi:hypothetical protein
VTHETHRCSIEGCPNLASYEVRLYDFDAAEGAVLFERDDTCPYICFEHAIDNERQAPDRRDLHTAVAYPYTNLERRAGVCLYLDLRPADAA